MNGQIRFEDKAPGLRIAHVENDAGTATISLFGGQLLGWQPKHAAEPALWTSSLAKFDGKTAIRGGVPICWPWFGKHPTAASAPAHGYARLTPWDLESIHSRPDGRTEVVMTLRPAAQAGEYHLRAVELAARFLIGHTLEISTTSTNRGEQPIDITEGLHTYFHVGHVEHVRVSGLQGCEYVDLTDGNQRRVQAGPIRFEGTEVGRIFTGCKRSCTIEDPGLGRIIRVDATGGHSIAVWNPGLATASRMADLGHEGWRHMVCVETANALEDKLTLAAGASHTVAATYTVSPLPG